MERLTVATPQETRLPGAAPFVPQEAARQAGEAGPPAAAASHSAARSAWARWLRHPFALIVVLPTLLVAGFEYLIAADQYQAQAQFIVRGVQSGPQSSGLSQMLGLNPGPSPSEAHSVGAYLVSHDALTALGRTLDLPALFRRPEADVATRLWYATPEPETLLRYYQGKVRVDYNTETGITSLDVRAFRPADAKALAEELLRIGEARVNELNARMERDGLRAAQRQLEAAENEVAAAQAALTSFRQSQTNIDPERTSSAQITLVSQLQAQARHARAQLEAMARTLSPEAPQYVALARQVRALEAQVAEARGQLAGSSRSMAVDLGSYEALKLRQQSAARRYEAAAAALQAAREHMQRQQLFIVRVVEPNLPGKALYPKRLKIIATVFFGLMLAYAIGWLILAGVREHAD